MKTLIKSVELLGATVVIITKSNKVIKYKFDTVRGAAVYFNDISIK